jgi:Prenyltransferase and squalene oxidase repeat
MHQWFTAGVIGTAILLLSARPAPSAEPTATTPDAMKAAVAKALPLLVKGAKGHVEQRICFACHNQASPILALTTAQERGFPVADEFLKTQREFIAEFLDDNRDKYRQGKGQGGQVDTAGYALFTLELAGWKPDATTEAVVDYLLQRDQDRDHWRTTSHRPPSEESDFTPTYLAIRALRRWGTNAQKERAATRIDAARGWLLQTKAQDTEDRVFRLWALREAGAEEKDLRPTVQELMRSQRADGGWAQTDTMDSDAYATGSALVALHREGGLPTDDPAYQRGVAFLVKHQRPDGSWLVHSRSKPFQTYFESGFPHGKDQFISIAASGWAATALALALPPAKPPDHPANSLDPLPGGAIQSPRP